MGKKKILFLWNYFYFPSEKGNSRFAYLAELLCKEGFELEIVTSSFYHMKKCKHNISENELKSLPYKVTFINERGYKKNVSFKRILSMKEFDKGVKKYLETINYVPDIIYVPVPSIRLGLYAKNYCKKHNTKLLIDIEDLWPESFRMLLKSTLLTKICFFPQLIQANKLYKVSDGIIAVSDTFLNRALSVRKDIPPHEVVYIGSDFELAKKEIAINRKIRKPQDEFWVIYIGTLGKSYDIKRCIDVFIDLFKHGHNNIKLKVLGSGPDEKMLKEYVKANECNVEFLGLLPYSEMINYINVSDIALNPIVGNSVASVINKVGDYASVGIPVINTQNCAEYMNIIEKYKCGFNIVPFDHNKMIDTIVECSKEENKKVNNVGLSTLFDRNVSYNRIVDLINNMIELKEVK